MEDHAGKSVLEAKKLWTVPELKKIDVEEVTGAATGPVDDGFTQES